MLNITELGLAWVAGSLTTLNPCVFPLLPLVLGGAVQANRWAPIAMGAGMVVMFATLGLLGGGAADSLGIDRDLIRLVGAWMLILLGLVMLVPIANEYFTRLLTPLASGAHHATVNINSGSLAGAFATGGLLSIVWSPCSGPMLASALTMVATDADVVRGTVILSMFGLGAASVLVAVAYASRSGVGKVRAWGLAHMDRVKKIFSLFFLMVGLAILTGWDKWLEAKLVQWMPDAWVSLTTRF